MNPAIVIPAFNRPRALNRLLSSLSRSYIDSKVNLVLSIEGHASKDVIDLADSYKSDKFKVRLIYRELRLGLRNHIIACGDLSEEYGSIIMLEDDLWVDPYFYMYAKSALEFYRDDQSIAGISLYAYERNEFCGLPFHPMYNGFSTYLMQIVSSWGQCWSNKQWIDFKAWYYNNSAQDLAAIHRLPDAVKLWPETSWKKYFHGYIVDLGKYFIYPYLSLSTNCSDLGGTHMKTKSSLQQVHMSSPVRPKPEFLFCNSPDREVIYDSFMEPIGQYINSCINLSTDEVECDLQGSKPLSLLKEKKYSITTRRTSVSIQNYSLDFRPHEVNLAVSSHASHQHGELNLTLSSNIIDQSSCTDKFFRYLYYFRINMSTKDFIVIFGYSFLKVTIKKVFYRLPKIFRKSVRQ